MNNLFIEDKSDLLHDSWMLSRPTTSKLWYDKLIKSSKDEILPEKLKSAENVLSDEECLVMSKISKLDPIFSAGVGDCNVKHSVVCRVEPQNINPLTRPGKFPCQKPNYFGRRKRSSNPNEEQELLKGKGKEVQSGLLLGSLWSYF